MRKKIIFSIVIVVVIILLGGCKKPWDHSWVRELKINDPDLSLYEDGVYRGTFTYSRFKHVVDTYVVNHRYDQIIIIENKGSERAKLAEEVVNRVLEEQTLLVDTVTGATTSSIALLKAIENGFLDDN